MPDTSSFIKYYIPELNKHFNSYWKEYGDIELDHVYLPYVESNDASFAPANSFLELLFNNYYDNSGNDMSSYNHLFKEVPINTTDPSTYRRLKLTGRQVNAFTTTDDVSGTDIYNIGDSTAYNRIMLDKLLDYRFGAPPVLTDVDYNSIDVNLAKLIYIYLDLMVNGIYEPFDTVASMSDPETLLDNLFELYVVNESHRMIKIWKDIVVAETLVIRPVRKRFSIESDTDASNYYSVTITDPLPHDTDKIYVFYNGTFLNKDEDYSLISDSSSFNITLDSSGPLNITLRDTDVLVVDYYQSIDVPLEDDVI